MDFMCWSMSGAPTAREKTDLLHSFMNKYIKTDVIDDLPTSFKVQKRWQDEYLPTLPLKSYTIKVTLLARTTLFRSCFLCSIDCAK